MIGLFFKRCKAFMFFPLKDLKTFESIHDKYTGVFSPRSISKWITKCLMLDCEVDAIWFRSNLVTFIPSATGELFSVSLFSHQSKHFIDDRTLLLSPFLEKNFGVSDLTELHSALRIIPDDLVSTVNEIEFELFGFL